MPKIFAYIQHTHIAYIQATTQQHKGEFLYVKIEYYYVTRLKLFELDLYFFCGNKLMMTMKEYARLFFVLFTFAMVNVQAIAHNVWRNGRSESPVIGNKWRCIYECIFLKFSLLPLWRLLCPAVQLCGPLLIVCPGRRRPRWPIRCSSVAPSARRMVCMEWAAVIHSNRPRAHSMTPCLSMTPSEGVPERQMIQNYTKWYKMIHPRLVSTECSLQIGCAMQQKKKRTWFSLSRYNSVMACQSTVNECGFGCRRGIHAAPKIFGKLARWYSGSGVFGKNTNNSLAVVNALTRLVYKSTTIRSTDNFNDDFNRSVNRFHIRMRFSVHAITRWENSPEQKATCLICVVNLMGVVGTMVTSSSASGVGSAFGSFSLSARPFVCAAAVALLVVVGLRASLVKRISRWTAWFKSIVFRRRNLYWCNLRLDLYFARCVIDLLRLKRSSSCICTRWLSM